MKRTALASLHQARGAHMMERDGWEIAARYSDLGNEYQALQEGVGLVDLSHRQILRFSGRDARTWLHGQVTQDIKRLANGRGAYGTILTVQGKMVCDFRVYALGDALIMDAPCGTTSPIAEHLDRFLIMERVEIEDLTDQWSLLSLQGPLSRCALIAALGPDAEGMEPWDVRDLKHGEASVIVARGSRCGEDGYDLFVPSEGAPSLWAALCQGRREFAVHPAGWEALNARRLEAGIPWWGEELDSSIVPFEARLDNAISLNKGCYVGQEIIARIDARGHVNNLLAGFLVHGDRLPERGAEIHVDGKKVGKVGSAIHSPKLERGIALGFLRRELQEPGRKAEVITTDGPITLEVATLPFVPNDFTGAPCVPCGAA